MNERGNEHWRLGDRAHARTHARTDATVVVVPLTGWPFWCTSYSPHFQLHAGMVFERWIEGGRRAVGSREVDAEDCFQCKLSGSVVFAGVSGYLLNERRGVPVTNGSQRRFLLGFAALFGTMSVGRWFAREIYDTCFRKDLPPAIPPAQRTG